MKKLTQEEKDKKAIVTDIVVIVSVLAFMFIAGGYFAVWIDRLTESCYKCKVEETYQQRRQHDR
jgi:hypothetical protein